MQRSIYHNRIKGGDGDCEFVCLVVYVCLCVYLFVCLYVFVCVFVYVPTLQRNLLFNNIESWIPTLRQIQKPKVTC